MAEMLSAGVFVTEIDASTIAPTVSNSIGVFGGDFVKGPVGTYKLITSVADLLSFYGKPTNTNYNDFYQAYNFLQYGNKLLVSRAANINGTATEVNANPVTGLGAVEFGTDTGTISSLLYTAGYDATVATGAPVVVTNVATTAPVNGDQVVFDDGAGTIDFANIYTVDTVVDNTGSYDVTFVEAATGADIVLGAAMYIYTPAVPYVDVTTGSIVGVTDGTAFTIGDIVAFETTIGGGVNIDIQYVVTAINGNDLTLDRAVDATILMTSAVFNVSRAMNGVAEATSVGGVDATANEYFPQLFAIENASDYETKELSIPFAGANAKLKFIARNPGAWSADLEIAIATPAAFNAATASEAFAGIALDDLFEYAPTGTEFGIIIRDNSTGLIVETWTVDSDPLAKDHNQKSTYVENVINNQSNYVFCKDNTANAVAVADYCASVNAVAGSTISLVWGSDSAIAADDLLNAYDLFSNKEELDVDIVIANELDGGASANALTLTRLDCIGFIGADYGDCVGQKSATATANLITWRQTGNINFNNMFVVACGNYKYQYDRYNDKYRWINIAGDIAGLRAQTSTNRASWFASAGLERGQVKNVTKLAFNPTQGQRDLLYKNGINPIVAFPGQGTVMWGQKTLLDKPSSFDRVNVRGLFNTMERSLSKMAKYQIMEFNDNFTRNRIVSMIKPYLGSVQAGRGIQDFLVICDESNNTADVISRNQLIVDIYIKPTYVAEFIQLRFTNAGTNSFAEVIGG